MKNKFPFGEVFITPGASDLIAECCNAVSQLLRQHGNLEQGLLSDSDYQLNLQAVDSDTRIFSAFKLHGGKVWVITEADRSATTILLTEEY